MLSTTHHHTRKSLQTNHLHPVVAIDPLLSLVKENILANLGTVKNSPTSRYTTHAIFLPELSGKTFRINQRPILIMNQILHHLVNKLLTQFFGKRTQPALIPLRTGAWLLALLTAPFWGVAQVTYSSTGPLAGGTGEFPDGPTSTTSTSGWTEFHAYNAGGTDNTWSTTVEIGFPFEFFGQSVTHFICSKNFLLSFDTTLTGTTVSGSIADNGSLPDANLPDNTIAYFWDNFAGGTSSLGTNDDIWYTVVGMAPNRQLWVKNYSYETEGSTFTYNHVILEETTNNIYFYDSYSGTNAAGSRTIGVQLDASTAVQTVGSPNEQSTNSSSSFATSSYWLFTPQLLVQDNAGMASIVAPVNPLVVGNQSVTAQFVNAGTNSITSVMFNATIDDGSSVTTLGPTAISETVAAGDTSSTHLIDSYTFSNGTYTISAWTTMPNGVADTVNSNDTVTVTVCTPLNGAYTINSGAATGGTNYASFGDFANALETCGVNGPVTATVTSGSGPYNEQFALSQITGTSATNTITIEGNGETIQADGASPNYGIVTLNGADYVTIDSLTIVALGGTTTTMGVLLSNQSHNATIQNCTIDLSANLGSTSSSTNGIVASGSLTSGTTTGDNARSLNVTGNTVIGGYYGIRLNGESGTLQDAIVSNNTVRDFYSYGIYLYYNDGSVVEDNDVSRPNRTSVSTLYGIYLSSSTDCDVLSNAIHNTHDNASSLTGSAYAIYHSSADGTAGNEHRVINNVVYNFNSNGTVYALYNSGSDYVQYYHNSISLDHAGSTGGTTRGLHQTTTATGLELKNNIFSLTRGGSGVKTGIYMNASATTIDCDYNAIYLGGAGTGALHVGYYSGSQTTLADWQAANGGIYGANSVDTDPLLALPSVGDLTPQSGDVNESGTNLGIADDYNDVARDATPDMGAIEFTPPAANLCMLALTGGLDTLNCFSSTESFGFQITNVVGSTDFSVDGLSIQWSVSGPTMSSGSIAVTSGTMAAGDTATYNISGTVDMSAIGEYTISAYLMHTPDNIFTNDTLEDVALGTTNLVVSATDEDIYLGESTDVMAEHPLLAIPVAFTEFWLYTTAYSSSITFPAHLTGAPTSVDYIEITNFGSGTADLAGWEFERVGSSNLTYAFPGGATIPSGESMVLITGSGTDDPANSVFYIGGSADAVFSSTSVGFVLRDGSGNVVDAAAANGYSFSNDVTASDWSGSVPSSSSQMGIYLNGLDDNTASNWAVTSSGYQNTATMGVANGSSNASDPIVDWTLNAMPITDSLATLTVAPASAGAYLYAATFTGIDGCTYSDDVTVNVDADSCMPPTNVHVTALTDSSAVIEWDTVPGATAYKVILRNRSGGADVIAFKHTNEGQITLTGLPADTRWFILVRAQCGAGFATQTDRVIFSTLPTVCTPISMYDANPVGSTRARINWTTPATAEVIMIRWKPQGDSLWTDTVRKDTSRDRHWLTGLAAATTYRWQIKAPCTKSGIGTDWSPVQTFTTAGTNKLDLFGTAAAGEATDNVFVFPNPSNGQFQVEFVATEEGNRTLQLTNAVGQMVYTNRVAVAEGQSTVAIDLADVPTGVYFLRIASDEGTTVHQLIIE